MVAHWSCNDVLCMSGNGFIVSQELYTTTWDWFSKFSRFQIDTIHATYKLEELDIVWRA